MNFALSDEQRSREPRSEPRAGRGLGVYRRRLRPCMLDVSHAHGPAAFGGPPDDAPAARVP